VAWEQLVELLLFYFYDDDDDVYIPSLSLYVHLFYDVVFVQIMKHQVSLSTIQLFSTSSSIPV